MKREKLQLIAIAILIAAAISFMVILVRSLDKWDAQVKRINTQERQIKSLQSQVQSLENRQTTRFLRMATDATFYKGNEVEIWVMKSD